MGSNSLGVPILWNLKLNLAPGQTLGVSSLWWVSAAGYLLSAHILCPNEWRTSGSLSSLLPVGLRLLPCFVSECECFEIYVWLHYSLVWVLEPGWHHLKIWLYNLLGVTTEKLSTSLQASAFLFDDMGIIIVPPLKACWRITCNAYQVLGT